MKVVRLSALCTGRLNPPLPGDMPGTHFRQRMSQLRSQSATEVLSQ